MNIKQKFIDRQNVLDNPLPVIAFIGDSVTQGCFECFFNEQNQIDTVFRPHLAYSRLVADKLTAIYDRVPPTIINAGRSGDTAWGIFERLGRDVLQFYPDLTIVSCGLNDCNCSTAEEYGNNLSKIFDQLKRAGSEVIFLTENMMCTYVPDMLTDQRLIDIAKRSAEKQNSGELDKFFDTAKAVAKKFGVRVCDCYSKWKEMAKDGVDTTALLSNGINHPTAEMLHLFADELVKIILE